MFIMGEIGEQNYYTSSEGNLNLAGLYEGYLSNPDKVEAQFLGNHPAISGKPYSKEAFGRLYQGMHPDTLDPITKRQTGTSGSDHKAGVDMVLCHNKSYSMLYSMAPPAMKGRMDEIENRILKDIILPQMAKLVRPSCQKAAYQQGYDPSKTRIGMALFSHFENRNQDPHKHKHQILFNFADFTYTHPDGTEETKTLALDTQQLFASSKYLTALYNTKLAEALNNELGIQTETPPDNDYTFRVKGISEEQELLFSDRRQEVLEQFKAQTGKKYSSEDQLLQDFDAWEKAAYLEKVRRGTADQKQELSFAQLMQLQNDKMARHGIDYAGTLARNNQPTEAPVFDREKLAKEIMAELTATNGYFSEQQLNIKLLNRAREYIRGNSADELIRQLSEQIRKAHPPILIDPVKRIFTTRQVVINEFQALESTRNLAQQTSQPENPTLKNAILGQFAAKGMKLNEGQLSAIDLVARGNRLNLITGDAGTGKTSTVIQFGADYYKAMGYEVVGLATQGKTSTALSEAGIGTTRNLAEFFAKPVQSDKPMLLVLDEAGMVGAEHYSRLMQFALEHNATVIAVGDSKQLASVGYGNTFASLQQEIPQTLQARLWENMRQKTPSQKAIAEAFRDRNPELATTLLKQEGCLNLAASPDEAMDRLVSDYFASPNDKIVLAYENKDVSRLNDLIRTRLIEMGRLNAERQKPIAVLASSAARKPQTRYFCAGDRIVFTGKHKAKGNLAENGAAGIIKKLTGNRMVVELEDKRTIVVDTKAFNKFSHAYCMTTYKSQGMTQSEVMVFSNGKTTANQAYVDFSRHKDRVSLYIQQDRLETFIANACKAQEKFTTLSNAACKAIWQACKAKGQDAQPFRPQAGIPIHQPSGGFNAQSLTRLRNMLPPGQNGRQREGRMGVPA